MSGGSAGDRKKDSQCVIITAAGRSIVSKLSGANGTFDEVAPQITARSIGLSSRTARGGKPSGGALGASSK
jgi:hypothetical protein